MSAEEARATQYAASTSDGDTPMPQWNARAIPPAPAAEPCCHANSQTRNARTGSATPAGPHSSSAVAGTRAATKEEIEMFRPLATTTALTAALMTSCGGNTPADEASRHLEALSTCMAEAEQAPGPITDQIITTMENTRALTWRALTTICGLEFETISEEARELLIRTEQNRLHASIMRLAAELIEQGIEDDEEAARHWTTGLRDALEVAADRVND